MEEPRRDPPDPVMLRVLNAALSAAGIPRDDVYLTNAVKHFRHRDTPRGKRRIHEKPGARILLTTHPSALLRLRKREGWDEAFDGFVADLEKAWAAPA